MGLNSVGSFSDFVIEDQQLHFHLLFSRKGKRGEGGRYSGLRPVIEDRETKGTREKRRS